MAILVKVGGGKVSKPFLNIFNEVDGLNPDFALGGTFTLNNTPPNANIALGRGTIASITPSIDVSEYDTLRIWIRGGWYNSNNGLSYPVYTRNGGTWIDSVVAESNYTERIIDISQIDILDLRFEGCSASTNSFVKFIQLEKREKMYLYKNGVQNVAWDNENYSLFSTYPKFSKEFKFNADAMVAIVQSTNDKSIDIGTNNIVELGDYRSVCFEIMYGNKSVISRVDISSVNSGYVSASVWTNSNKGFIRLHVSSTKSNVGEGSIALLAVENGTLAVGTTVSITRVWLEK